MNIGDKLQKSRTNVNLTQEQVAETLGVSRQTISNWENEKTYPDIKNIVILSDLYNVSLDYLLKDKEEKTMSNYLNYLEESTNTVKSKNKLSKLLLVLSYLIIWAFTLIAFWFMISDSDAMGYSLMIFYVLLPVTTFIISLLIAKNNYWNKCKWLSSLIFGTMYMLAEYTTFSLSNMLAFDKINTPEWSMILIGSIISLIGLGIGTLIYKKTNK
jgi:transcriptional regulator with XRE-family HTH domain